MQKPSRCPKPIGPGICVEMCSADDGCPIGEKCCSNGCGHVCMKAGIWKYSLKLNIVFDLLGDLLMTMTCLLRIHTPHTLLLTHSLTPSLAPEALK